MTAPSMDIRDMTPEPPAELCPWWLRSTRRKVAHWDTPEGYAELKARREKQDWTPAI